VWQKNKVYQGGTQETNEITRDWETYTNSKFGFEFKYPSDWKVVPVDPRFAIVFVANSFDEKNPYGAMFGQGTSTNSFAVLEITDEDRSAIKESNLPQPDDTGWGKGGYIKGSLRTVIVDKNNLSLLLIAASPEDQPILETVLATFKKY
jgi:hypothetical protein